MTRRIRTYRRASWLCGLLSYFCVLNANAVSFDDGGVHVIDDQNSFPFEGIFVSDGSDGSTTELWILRGAETGTTDGFGLQTEDASETFLSGATIGGLVHLFDASLLQIYAGGLTVGGGGLHFNPKCVLHDDAILVLSGGRISCDTQLLHRSQLQMTRGFVGRIMLYGDSEWVMSGGEIGVVSAGDSSHVEISGGKVEGRLYLTGAATAQIVNLDASLGWLFTFGENVVDVIGGVFDAMGQSNQASILRVEGAHILDSFGMSGPGAVGTLVDTRVDGEINVGVGGSLTLIDVTTPLLATGISNVVIRGNASTVDVIDADSTSVVAVRGGSFPGGAHPLFNEDFALVAREDSQISVYGGAIESKILAIDRGLIWIGGSGFNHPLGPVGPRSGRVTGVLADGTPIDVEFERASTGVILLPEPASSVQLMAALAITAFAAHRRGRHRRRFA